MRELYGRGWSRDVSKQRVTLSLSADEQTSGVVVVLFWTMCIDMVHSTCTVSSCGVFHKVRGLPACHYTYVWCTFHVYAWKKS